jgi:hypothetical protein
MGRGEGLNVGTSVGTKPEWGAHERRRSDFPLVSRRFLGGQGSQDDVTPATAILAKVWTRGRIVQGQRGQAAAGTGVAACDGLPRGPGPSRADPWTRRIYSTGYGVRIDAQGASRAKSIDPALPVRSCGVWRALSRSRGQRGQHGGEAWRWLAAMVAGGPSRSPGFEPDPRGHRRKVP